MEPAERNSSNDNNSNQSSHVNDKRQNDSILDENVRQQSTESEKGIFDLLGEFKEEVCSYLKGVFTKTMPVDEIFTRWYMNSLLKGEREYFMPEEFTALEDDLIYNEKYLKPDISKKEICDKVLAIFEKYKERKFSLKCEVPPSPPKNQKERLDNIYNDKKESGKDPKDIKNLLISAYNFMGDNKNIHLSVPPNLFNDIKITELFGSPLNTRQDYCSLFKLEEDYFSSKGSFFKFDIPPGIHVANPPFDETIMAEMVKRLKIQLEKNQPKVNLNIICIIPVWNSEKPFAAYDELIKLPFKTKEFDLGQYTYPFWDYYQNEFVPASATHFIVLSNTEELLFEPDKIIKNWEKFALPTPPPKIKQKEFRFLRNSS